jgi:hypothetical protein
MVSGPCFPCARWAGSCGLVVFETGSRSQVVESGPEPYAGTARGSGGYGIHVPVLGRPSSWYRLPSAADLDLAMPVIGLLAAGAQSSRDSGKGVMGSQVPGSARGCRAARVGGGGMTTAWWLLGPHCSQTTHVTFPMQAPPRVAACGGRSRRPAHVIPPRSSG